MVCNESCTYFPSADLYIFKCLRRVLERLAEFHASEKKPKISGDMSNSPFSSLHDKIPKTDVESFFWRRIFTNGNLLYLSVICLPLYSRAYTIKASQKFNDLISILSKLTKPFTFPYTVSNVYRPFVKSGRSPFIILIGCQTD